MGQIEARAWWADVQHLRDVHERTEEARRLADRAEQVSTRDRAEQVSTRDRSASRGRGPDAIAPRDRNMPDRRQREVEIVRQPAPRRGPHVKGSAVPTRRTIEIRGRTVPAPSVPYDSAEIDRLRHQRRTIQRVGPRPDRIAMWALLMGILLILVAVGTADASLLAH